MKRTGYLLSALLGGLLLLLPAVTGECYFTTRYQPVNIAPVGQFLLPADLAVTLLPKSWSASDAGSQLNSGELITAKQALGEDKIKELENYDITPYQLAIDDGENYRVAWLVALHDKRMLNKEAGEAIKEILTPEARSRMNSAQNAIQSELVTLNEKIKASLLADKKGKKGSQLQIQVLGLTPFEYPVLNGTQGYGAGMRLLVQTDALHLPFFVKGYAMGPDGHLSMLILLTMDSERDFWSPIWEQAVGTMKEVS